MSGLGYDGAGRMVKVRAADGREMRVKKLFDARGKPVELVRAKRQAPEWLKQRNELVKAVMVRENFGSLAQASAYVKAQGLWQR